MPIDFFLHGCKTSSSNETFGLCDDPSPARNPAYIDENSPDSWIATVENPNRKAADFYAIDHCVVVINATGLMQRRCDGLLTYESNLMFVELKDRNHSGWLGKGKGQLISTISQFAANHTLGDYGTISGVIANCQKPMANANYGIQIEKFKDEMQVLGISAKLTIDPKIEI